jgi:hypothetical protein
MVMWSRDLLSIYASSQLQYEGQSITDRACSRTATKYRRGPASRMTTS